MKIENSKSEKTFDLINYTLLGIILLVYIYPLYFVLVASISDPTAVWQGKTWIRPIGLNIEAYKVIFEEEMIWIGYRNTIFYTVVGTTINLFMTVTCAYPLSRKDFYPRKALMIFYAFTMFFNGGLIPTYLVVRNLGMINTVWAMLIPTAVAIWNVIITRSYFQSTIPDELLESAQIDGCSNTKFLLKIVLPLSKPILAVMALYYGVAHWNAFFNAFIYLNDKNLFPLQIILRDILIVQKFSMDMVLDAKEADEAAKLAELLKYGIIIVASLPILMVYPFVQKYFIKGIMVGSLKG